MAIQLKGKLNLQELKEVIHLDWQMCILPSLQNVETACTRVFARDLTAPIKLGPKVCMV